MTLKRYFTSVIFILLSTLAWSQGSTNRAYWTYIDQYKDMAMEQQQKYKIPASITLAQGLLESGAGRSRLATVANNHFGIKVSSGWTGPYVLADDDRPKEKFRKYKNARESYEDHSLFLQKPRYERLFTYKITDYKSWAKGLKACGYATSPTYAQSLINIIEMYSLHQFDKRKPNTYTTTTTTTTTSPNVDPNLQKLIGKVINGKLVTSQNLAEFNIFNARGEIGRISKYYLNRLAKNKIKESKIPEFFRKHAVYKNNSNYFIVVQAGDDLATIAQATGLSVYELLDFNDLDLSYHLTVGDILYLRKKRTKAASEYKHQPHIVQPGQSMYDISQMYGIRLKNLYKLNALNPRKYNIKINDMIWLR